MRRVHCRAQSMPRAADLTALPAAIRHRDAAIRCAAPESAPRSSRLQRSWPCSFDLIRQLFGLMFLIEGAHQLVEIAVHHVIELVQGEIDAMVGHAALRKIVGAYALGAIAGPYLQLTRLRLGALLLLAFRGQELGFEQGHGARTILVLRALVLTFHHDPGR